ncbi:NUDIX domain-containing protein [Lutibacter sp. A80]|uniref:NUDIX hydrolase n=1 Tax=Lutibacter sp. A80 TaxID=2918453 RepID=UPI001F05267A|nr:NUDIX domain-containing protein [Lutibacter sp. A80]UMB61290.1 NUDIX domain-containing protein [Lutibacter sp. A80]
MQLLNNKNAYKHQKKILIAVDCVIFGFDSEQLKLLLFRRKVEPLKGAWSLIGAFVNEDLSLNDAAKEVVFNLTGLDNIFLEELKTYSKVDRDPGERVISVAHYSLIRINDFNLDSVEKFDARWFNIDEVPELIIDHKEMVEDAILKIRKKARFQPIGFELLPEKFTIPHLQILYECIYQKKLDDRNFRKKILSFDILTKTEEKDRTGSKKGAFLYKFNKEKFNNFISKGYNFEL